MKTALKAAIRRGARGEAERLRVREEDRVARAAQRAERRRADIAARATGLTLRFDVALRAPCLAVRGDEVVSSASCWRDLAAAILRGSSRRAEVEIRRAQAARGIVHGGWRHPPGCPCADCLAVRAGWREMPDAEVVPRGRILASGGRSMEA